MDMSRHVYLACPEPGLKLAIGRPLDVKWIALEVAPNSLLRPGHRPTRRVLLQTLSKLLTDHPIGGMSLCEGRSRRLNGLREIGGDAEDGGIPFADYLADQPLEWVTYYFRTRTGIPRLLGGVVRRREIDGVAEQVDEAFTRRLRWEPTDYLDRYRRKHDDIDRIEFSEGEAFQFVLRRLVSRLPFVPGR